MAGESKKDHTIRLYGYMCYVYYAYALHGKAEEMQPQQLVTINPKNLKLMDILLSFVFL